MQQIPIAFVILAVPALLVLFAVCKAIVVVPENSRAGLFRLGKFERILGPGLHIVIPLVDRAWAIQLNDKLPGWQGLSKEDVDERARQLILAEMR